MTKDQVHTWIGTKKIKTLPKSVVDSAFKYINDDLQIKDFKL